MVGVDWPMNFGIQEKKNYLSSRALSFCHFFAIDSNSSKKVVGVECPMKALPMYIQKSLRITKGDNSNELALPSPYFFH